MKLFRRGGSATEAKAPEIGCTVLDRDGAFLGSVQQVQGGYFEIDMPGDPDFWLSSVYVDSNDGERIRLSLNSRETAEHRLRAPGLSASAETEHEEVRDQIISDEEALAQRERMERELIRQRGGLDSGAEGVAEESRE
jgi:hypothetical protein